MTTTTKPLGAWEATHASKFVPCHRGGYVVEKRDPNTGALQFDAPQPPFICATEEQIINAYFRAVPGDVPASQESIAAWYAASGWFYRPKTW